MPSAGRSAQQSCNVPVLDGCSERSPKAVSMRPGQLRRIDAEREDDREDPP